MENFKKSNIHSFDSYTMYDYEFNAESNTVRDRFNNYSQ